MIIQCYKGYKALWLLSEEHCHRNRRKIPTASSASPSKVIFCPCCIPFSTCTSSTFLSCTTFCPLHCPHLSFSLITSPTRKNMALLMVESEGGRQKKPNRWSLLELNMTRAYKCGKSQQGRAQTGSFALRTHMLHLLDHAWTKLTNRNLRAWTLASRTLARCTTLWSLAAQNYWI